MLQPCECCGGIGVIEWVEYVTRDMAKDACEPDMEGMPIPCSQTCPDCSGHGLLDTPNNQKGE